MLEALVMAHCLCVGAAAAVVAAAAVAAVAAAVAVVVEVGAVQHAQTHDILDWTLHSNGRYQHAHH